MSAFAWVVLSLTAYAAAHGEHGSGLKPGETIQQYAQRHMATEHHIDSFDIPSFFHLHDLDRDGYWNREEIEAVYGVHHVYSQKKSKDEEEHAAKAKHIVDEVLLKIDTNHDGRIDVEELKAAGLDALPNFHELGAEGHHYDVESEFFLHHEEEFHSTPETQTDESYVHPEDLEHFAHHEKIEREEAEKEAKYQGISVEEVLKIHEEAEKAAAQAAAQRKADEAALGGHPGDQFGAGQPMGEAPPQYTRVPPPEKQDPNVRFKDAKSAAEAKGEWGSGAAGYKAPRDASDRLRKGLPYKYKFRRSWGDF